MKTPKEILIAAKALIDTPEKWTKLYIARDRFGSPIYDIYSREAACFCSVGAIAKACHHAGAKSDGETKAIFKRANQLLDIAYWNDKPKRTHAEVMAAFDRAIAAADL